MKHILITTIAAVVLVGCGESQQSAPAPETKPVEPVAENTKPEPTALKTSDISLFKARNVESAKEAIAAGADVNAKDLGGLTDLHYAASGGQKEITELLIAEGADVNAKDESGKTPLHWAAWRGHKEVAELLIANDADVNASKNNGITPLDLAVDKETTDLLRKHGAK